MFQNLENEPRNFSLKNRPPSSADSETGNFSVASKIKNQTARTKVSKFTRAITNWQQFESALLKRHT